MTVEGFPRTLFQYVLVECVFVPPFLLSLLAACLCPFPSISQAFTTATTVYVLPTNTTRYYFGTFQELELTPLLGWRIIYSSFSSGSIPADASYTWSKRRTLGQGSVYRRRCYPRTRNAGPSSSHGWCPVRTTGGALQCKQYLLSHLTGSTERSLW